PLDYDAFFFFQAEDGIRDRNVTGVQTCALPISPGRRRPGEPRGGRARKVCREADGDAAARNGGDPMSALRLDPVEDAIAAIAAGAPVVVVDDEDRENEGDLILAASAATPALIGFAVRHSSGL